MKIFKMVLLTGILLLMNFSLAFGEVNISVDESKVGNLIYRIQRDGVFCIEDGSIFYLVDYNGNIVDEVKSKDSMVVFENVHFGNYTLEYNNGELKYDIVVDKSYLDSQHIVKVIDISEEKEKLDYLNNKNNLPSTGIESNKLNIAFIILIIGFALFKKRKEVMQ